jgi:hypothetical protein
LNVLKNIIMQKYHLCMNYSLHPQLKLVEQGKLYFLRDVTITDFTINTSFFSEERPV